ncbi:hypothetical protein ACR6C2_19070 [Streptomyces sp. INA 01156]
MIPLRPLGVGEILDGAVSTMRTHWRTVLGLSLTIAVLIQLVVVLVQGLFLDSSSAAALGDPSATLDELTGALGASLLNSGMVSMITLIGALTATALLATVTSRAVLGTSVTAAEAWRTDRPQVLKLCGLIFLLLLIAVAVIAVGALPASSWPPRWAVRPARRSPCWASSAVASSPCGCGSASRCPCPR